MKNILTTLFFLALLSLNAQELEHSTLWKIEGNGLEKPSYLFGTIHITCDATIDDDVKNALDETTQVVLEVDMDDPELQTKTMNGMFMSNGKTLSDLVTPEEFQRIDSLFTKHIGMSVKMMQNVKPFFLSAMLYPLMLNCPAQSYETKLMEIAQNQGEEILGLETIEEQIQVFEDIPYETQVKDLLRTANDDLEYDKAMFKKLMATYEKEDINSMIDLMNDENYTAVAKHQDKLLDNRNKNWIPKIETFAKQEPTFFGVGAAHLAGENGIIMLLRKAGYTVTAVQ